MSTDTYFDYGFTFLCPAFQLGPRKKQADAGIRPTADLSHSPSIVLEVGDSESLTQLKIDAKLWLEHMPEVSHISLLQYTHRNFIRYNWSSSF